jgi:hypothetical protein
MPGAKTATLWVSDGFKTLFDQIHFEPEMIFGPAVKPWRTLRDRENCVWDISRPNGTTVRMHVKRYVRTASKNPAEKEAAAYRLLAEGNIAASELAAWGRLEDGRAFVVIPDLAGFQPADKLIQSGEDFQKLIFPTADLAAKLHNANLHHRDLYLCHFFARTVGDAVEVRLIDAARVARLPALTSQRWIVKDLAQFWYSSTELPITDAQRLAWLSRYAQKRKIAGIDRLRRSIERKCKWIAAHDARLRKREPKRNISIPRI